MGTGASLAAPERVRRLQAVLQRPHAELLKCVARRVGDGRMVGWVKAWWERAKACSRPRAGCGRPASGSMSGDWKRSNGVERGTGTAKAAGKRLPPPA